MKKFGLIGIFFITSILLIGCSQLGDQSKKNSDKTWVKITNSDAMDGNTNIINKKAYDDYSGFFYEIKGKVTGDVKNGDKISLLQSSSNGNGLYVVDTAKVGDNKNPDENNSHGEFTLSAIVESDFIDTEEDVYITSDSLSQDSGYTPEDMSSLKHCLKISIKKPSDSEKEFVEKQNKVKEQEAKESAKEWASEEKAKAEAEAKEKAFQQAELNKALNEAKATEGLTGNALAQAKQAISYLRSSHMSKQGLYDQLTSEYGAKLSTPEANAAIAKIDPFINWNNLAVLSAQSYRNSVNLTGQALLDQLISEHGAKFTPEQAQYGIDHIDDEVESSDFWNK